MDMRARTWILIAVTTLAPGCGELGKSEASEKAKGKAMENRLEEIVSEYPDIYMSPTSERITELELKLADLQWEGLFLAAPDTIEPAIPGIPILALSGSTAHRAWDVDPKKNSTVILADLDRGAVSTSALYKPPSKPMKPVPKPARPAAGNNGRRYGCVRQVVGESLSNGLLAGTYAIALISWDRVSNSRQVDKKGVETGKKSNSNDPMPPVQWPWRRWADSQAFKASQGSPKVDGKSGLAINFESAGRILLGGVSISARPIHIIPAESEGRTESDIRAGVNVDLLLYTLDQSSPEQARVEVPIYSSSSIAVGGSIQGWFSVPFPFPPSSVDRMLYAVADGNVAGPVRIPGNKP